MASYTPLSSSKNICRSPLARQYYKLQLQVHKLNELYTYEIAKFMYEYTHKNLSLSFFSFFLTSVASVHTRSTALESSQYSLYLPRYETLKLQRNIKLQGVKIWNSVPQEKNYPSSDLKYNIKSTSCQIILDVASFILFGNFMTISSVTIVGPVAIPHRNVSVDHAAAG